LIQKKICMVGAFAVGKTSLVRRFVKSIFDERYLTTVGVKIDKKILRIRDTDVMIMLWDLEGQDSFHNVRTSYMRGASGYFVVADGTDRNTLDIAADLQRTVEQTIGKVPFLLVLNKADLTESWEVVDDDLQALSNAGVDVRLTSAKTGEGVEQAFQALAERMVDDKAAG
jgi:small GTP-binding protein